VPAFLSLHSTSNCPSMGQFDLLITDKQQPLLHAARSKSQGRTFWFQQHTLIFIDWWEISTSEHYLSSPQSRRPWLCCSLVVWWVWQVAMQAAFEFSVDLLARTLAQIVGTIAITLVLPRSSLKTDVLIMLSFAIAQAVVVWRSMAGCSTVNLDQELMTLSNSLSFFALAGVHLVVTVPTWICIVIFKPSLSWAQLQAISGSLGVFLMMVLLVEPLLVKSVMFQGTTLQRSENSAGEMCTTSNTEMFAESNPDSKMLLREDSVDHATSSIHASPNVPHESTGNCLVVCTADAGVQTDALTKPPKCPSSQPLPLPRPQSDSSLEASSSGSRNIQEEWMGLMLRGSKKNCRGTRKVAHVTIGPKYPPRVPTFQPTPVDTVRILIYQVLEKINTCGKGCCSWHVGLAQLLLTLKALNDGSCPSHFEPSTDWQCNACLACHWCEDNNISGKVRYCDVCAEENPAGKLSL